jgi:hypothetical protein
MRMQLQAAQEASQGLADSHAKALALERAAADDMQRRLDEATHRLDATSQAKVSAGEAGDVHHGGHFGGDTDRAEAIREAIKNDNLIAVRYVHSIKAFLAEGPAPLIDFIAASLPRRYHARRPSCTWTTLRSRTCGTRSRPRMRLSAKHDSSTRPYRRLIRRLLPHWKQRPASSKSSQPG